ncbi:hypothetical protein SAMN05660293_04715 [Dyadobacter psychrophilus]|uniref:PBCV-specific basic adaptor domain-containing protein n=1 Tax=Dyadobacter psychrophilus TaxID=651661 RepID=A0A1T5H0J7_9BACT|nr:hypothetical protein SAMN05660293_04715 [Dyadobacter psychrophilus]
MNKIILLLALISGISINASAQYKKDGTPDMRYKSNQSSVGSYNLPSYSSTPSSEVRYQSGYLNSSGTYVEPHYKTNSNRTNWDNLSTEGNYNMYNSTQGTKARDYSIDAYNYGKNQTIQTGPNGGQYYTNDRGNKVYVPKR